MTSSSRKESSTRGPRSSTSSTRSGKRSSSTSVDDDAALAKRLQQQLDDEEIAQRIARSERDGSTRRERTERKNPPESSQRQNRSSTRSSSSSKRRSSTDRDRSTSNNRRRSSTERSSRSSSRDGSKRSSDKPRIEKAKLVELESEDRELTDEELARKLTEKETLGNLVRLKPENMPPPPKRWTMRRICTLAIPLLVIVAAVIGIVFAFNGGAAAALNGLPPTVQQGDPFLGKSVSQLSRWSNGGKGGLSLEVINALDSKWNSEFQLAVNDWDYGSPDALTLSTTQGTSDSQCKQLPGKLKVCNGNYGDTQWLGINEVITNNGIIVSSAARMNDFYLNTAIESQRQYTMCHEIGHGFGLPHTDENFYNKDLGNCLDYTIHPWVNEHPSAMNYDVLVQLYGTVGSRRLRGLFSKHAVVAKEVEHPSWVFEKFEEARARLAERGYLKPDENGWTVVHRSPFGEGHKLDLGEGYTAHVDILMVTDGFYERNGQV